MTMREEFEKWAKEHEDSLGDDYWLARESEGYYNVTVQIMWEAWQASRAAIEVELPTLSNGNSEAEIGYDIGVGQCRNLIEAKGLRVKQ